MASFLPLDLPDSSDLHGLLPLLQRLDVRLERAIASRTESEPTEAFPEAIAGDVRPAAEELGGDAGALKLRSNSRLAWLQQSFALSTFDLETIAIAIAPELDRRYEKAYAYLQEDRASLRPTVDLALTLLCATTAEKLQRRAHLGGDCPLVRHELLHLAADPERDRPALLGRELHLDDCVVRFLLGQSGVGRQLQPYCRLWARDAIPDSFAAATAFQTPEMNRLAALVRADWHHQRSLRLYFQGPDRQQHDHLACHLAKTVRAPLLTIDLERLAGEPTQFERLLGQGVREARFQSALLFLERSDVLQEERDRARRYQQIWDLLATYSSVALLSGTQPHVPAQNDPAGVVPVLLPMPDAPQRRSYWQHHLQNGGVRLSETDLARLSDRFQLTPTQIASAVETACKQARWREIAPEATPAATPEKPPDLADLFAAARAQSGRELAALTRKIEPSYGWGDIVLPADTQQQLREICNQAEYRQLVQEDWGFNRKLSVGKGLAVLFAGPPGTGKTMAAEVVARELDLDLYQIDLSQVVSKFIGETEKNLDRIFTAATHANAVLLFDEADALFGKRTEVKDAHDRYANIETSYLLQKMEEYAGLAILTTNARDRLDDAFTRRLRFVLEFALPGVVERQRIWQQIWPEAVPLAADIDFEFLARQLEIPGAVIRNIALRSAYLAADGAGRVGMAEIMKAVRREYQKMGKILAISDMGKYGHLF